MTPEQRLAQLVVAIEEVGLETLVMGGHAVRYYGVDRNTVDYDFFASTGSADELRARIARSGSLKKPLEGPSWRPADFVRFEIGRLPDGREEWLEFWVRNHLLADFSEAHSRRERGAYGGREIDFISLPDLLRSKETERETDWQDISLLEEIQDARNLATVSDETGVGRALSRLRSRRGFERAVAMRLFDDRPRVLAAAGVCDHPVSFAFLLPLISEAPQPQSLRHPIDEAHLLPLRNVEFGGNRHHALVEIVRRAHKRWAMELDREDKQTHLRRD